MMKGLRKYLKKPWPYWLGGVLLGLINVALLSLIGMPWKVTQGLLFLEAGISNYTILNIGIIVGSLVATLLASEFKIKKIKDRKQVITALAGGIMMGYGAKLASGCNIGAFFSAIPSFSLHGWFFGIFAFLGAGLGVKLIVRFVL